jgi:hypothetical protein
MVDAWLAAMKDASGHRTGDPPEADVSGPQGPRRAALAVLSLVPRPRQVEHDDLLAAVRRPLARPRQITVVNPGPGAGKTVTTMMLGLTFGQARGGSVLAWDNSGAPGGLRRRATRGEETRRVRDLRRLASRASRPDGPDRLGGIGAGLDGAGHPDGANPLDRVSGFLFSQGDANFDVLTFSDVSDVYSGSTFRAIREVVALNYRLLVVDTGNDVAAANWLAALDATDQLVVAISPSSSWTTSIGPGAAPTSGGPWSY